MGWASGPMPAGNHDLSLLAVAHARAPHRNDTLDGVLLAPDRRALLHRLRQQRLALAETASVLDGARRRAARRGP